MCSQSPRRRGERAQKVFEEVMAEILQIRREKKLKTKTNPTDISFYCIKQLAMNGIQPAPVENQTSTDILLKLL